MIVCCNGYFIGIEVKASRGKPSPLQEYEIRKIGEAGGIGIIAYPKDFEALKTLIQNLKKE